MKDWSVDYFKDAWVKLGCFITGISYTLVRNTSEESRKSVKKYLSSIMLIAVPWFGAGYLFTERYFEGSPTECLIAGLLMVVLIIQVERVIILTVTTSPATIITRVTLGLLMAFIGATVLDQMIFEKDIENERSTQIQYRLAKNTDVARASISDKITLLDSVTSDLEFKLDELSQDILNNPPRRKQLVDYEYIPDPRDSTGKERIRVPKSSAAYVPSDPRESEMERLVKSISANYEVRKEYEEDFDGIQKTEEQRIRDSPPGPIEELKYMVSVVSSHWTAMLFYIIWFALLMMLEMLVLFTKLSSKETDYELILKHQSDINRQRLEQLK